ncbi:hypothetical protein ACHAL6_13495 [Proteiniclasticum sp. C24MP]|uniref:lysine 5,6-aminomutase reactivase ATPase KamC n=1 Tax=Proteiniclasticum sp. C24MP TaxID=3374101 RepID=UPI00375407BF
MMHFSRKEKQDMGLKFVMDLIRTGSPYGKEHKSKLSFYGKDKEEALQRELERTRDLRDRLPSLRESAEELFLLLHELRDIRNTVLAVEEGLVLSELDLFEIKYFLKRMHRIEEIRSFLLSQELKLERLDVIADLLDPAGTGLNTFYIYDEYDEELRVIRRDKKEIEKMIRSLRTPEEKNELLVMRRKIVAKEEVREYEVRRELSDQLKPYARILLRNMDIIGELDFLLAKAVLSEKFVTTLPVVGDLPSIHMVEGYHPYFAELLKGRGREFVPVSLEVRRGSTVITGANMGGKSISLKTLFLNVVLVQLGILPFASKMETPVLGSMHLLSVDRENPDQGLSSFGGEVVKITEVMEGMNEMPSLLVLDEPARGTNPVEGMAIVGGLLNFFRDRQHFLLVATHYDIKSLTGIHRYQVRGLREVNLDDHISQEKEDRQKQVAYLSDLMDYTLEKWDGTPIVGDAVKIGEFLGFQEDLTAEIKKLLE